MNDGSAVNWRKTNESIAKAGEEYIFNKEVDFLRHNSTLLSSAMSLLCINTLG